MFSTLSRKLTLALLLAASPAYAQPGQAVDGLAGGTGCAGDKVAAELTSSFEVGAVCTCSNCSATDDNCGAGAGGPVPCYHQGGGTWKNLMVGATAAPPSVEKAFKTMLTPNGGTSSVAESVDDILTLLGANGCTVATTNADEITFQCPATPPQFGFRTFDTPLGSDPVASIPEDTVKFISGAGCAITGNSVDKSITISCPPDGSGFTQEQIEDFVGTMFMGNVETGITVTYQDNGTGTGKIDFVVTALPPPDWDDIVGIPPGFADGIDNTGGGTGGGDCTVCEDQTAEPGDSIDMTNGLFVLPQAGTCTAPCTPEGSVCYQQSTDQVCVCDNTTAWDCSGGAGTVELAFKTISTPNGGTSSVADIVDDVVSFIGANGCTVITTAADQITFSCPADGTGFTQEQLEDFVGAMIQTETRIDVQYVDNGTGAGKLNFIVALPAWSDLTGVPAGFADGIDNTAGSSTDICAPLDTACQTTAVVFQEIELGDCDPVGGRCYTARVPQNFGNLVEPVKGCNDGAFQSGKRKSRCAGDIQRTYSYECLPTECTSGNCVRVNGVCQNYTFALPPPPPEEHCIAINAGCALTIQNDDTITDTPTVTETWDPTVMLGIPRRCGLTLNTTFDGGNDPDGMLDLTCATGLDTSMGKAESIMWLGGGRWRGRLETWDAVPAESPIIASSASVLWTPTTDGGGHTVWTATMVGGGGDMLKSVYDTDNDGKVNAIDLGLCNGTTQKVVTDANGIPSCGTDQNSGGDMLKSVYDTDNDGKVGAIDLGLCTGKVITDANGVPSCGTDATEAITAGDHLTRTADDFDLDVEIKTGVMPFAIYDSTFTYTTFSGLAQAVVPSVNGITLTRVDCSTDTGTVTIQLDQRTLTTPNTNGTDSMTTSLVCDTDNQQTASFTDAALTVDQILALEISAKSGSPTFLRVNARYTIND